MIGKIESPRQQIKWIVLGLFGFFVFTKLIFAFMDEPSGTNFYWIGSCTFLLLFIIINSLLAFRNEAINYWRDSIIGFLLISIVGVLGAWMASGLSIGEAGSFKWIYFVFGFGYLVILSIITAIKKIVSMAQNDKNDRRF